MYIAKEIINHLLVRLKFRKIGLLLFACIQLQVGFSHGDLSRRIEQKTYEINSNPTNNQLFYERGFLYHQHEEYRKAIKDYLKSETLGNNSSDLHLKLAGSYEAIKKFNKALKTVNHFLESQPDNVRGIKLKGHILAQQNKFKEASECFDYIMKHMIDIRPEDYVFYSDLTVSSKNDYAAALKIIEEGLSKLGNTGVSLQLKKLEYLIANNNSNAALKQYDYFINSVNRKEFWYYKKAKYLSTINDKINSKIALNLSKQSINKLPVRFKNLKAIKELINNITQLEKTLSHE